MDDKKILSFLENEFDLSWNEYWETTSCHKFRTSNKDEVSRKLSSLELDKIIKEHKDLRKCSKLSPIRIYPTDCPDVASLLRFLEDKFIITNYLWYPMNSWMGWHTNTHRTGERIYLVWAEEDNKSFFRYRDADTGEIITKWEKSGWQINRFNISTNPMFWHCVGSYTNRISIGLAPKVSDKET